MSKYTYKYEYPKGDRYILKGKKARWAYKRNLKWFMQREFYVDKENNKITIEEHLQWWFVLLLWMGSPFLFLINVLYVGFPEAKEDILDMLFSRTRGNFSSDVVYKRKEESWSRLLRGLGIEEGKS